MHDQSSATSRWNLILMLAVVIAMVTAWMVTVDRAGADAAPAAPVAAQAADLDALLALQFDDVHAGDIFAKYDGVDGESQDANHQKWVNVLGAEWGAHALNDVGADAAARSRGGVTVDEFALTFDYEKAVPKLAEKLLKGAVIPELKVEFTVNYGGARATYLKYEMKNVLLVDYAMLGEAGEGPPRVAFVNTFEEIKVTYTEYDSGGAPLGNVEYEYKVEK